MSCMCLHPIHMLCGNECPAYEVGACLQESRQVQGEVVDTLEASKGP